MIYIVDSQNQLFDFNKVDHNTNVRRHDPRLFNNKCWQIGDQVCLTLTTNICASCKQSGKGDALMLLTMWEPNLSPR